MWGGNDKDDAQSIIHALLFTNQISIKAFVTTRTDDGGRVNGSVTDGAAIIREAIDAFTADRPKLVTHDATYAWGPTLRTLIFAGSTNRTWPGVISPGASKIVSEARLATAEDPLWILTWGPIHDAARAILSAPDIVPNVRLRSISGQTQDGQSRVAYDALVSAVQNNPAYESLWWVNSQGTHRGMYLAANGDREDGINGLLPWVDANVRGHGALGALFWNKWTMNVHTTQSASASPDGLKAGDTPSLLSLIDPTSNPNDPTGRSWGGQFQPVPSIGPNVWGDMTDPSLSMGGYAGARTVFRERDAYLASFAERMDWARG